MIPLAAGLFHSRMQSSRKTHSLLICKLRASKARQFLTHFLNILGCRGSWHWLLIPRHPFLFLGTFGLGFVLFQSSFAVYGAGEQQKRRRKYLCRRHGTYIRRHHQRDRQPAESRCMLSFFGYMSTQLGQRRRRGKQRCGSQDVNDEIITWVIFIFEGKCRQVDAYLVLLSPKVFYCWMHRV